MFLHRRVDWYSSEDSFLLLCKVASIYLFPTKRHLLSLDVVRDLLHERFPKSNDKTKRACQRRVNYMLKNPVTVENVAVYLAELKQDPDITNDFQPMTSTINQQQIKEECAPVFKQLVDRLVDKFNSNRSPEIPELPDNIEEFYR